MAKVYREYEPDQDFLLPPSLKEWLPERHLAYFISEVVDEMDLSQIFDYYEKEERGKPPYHPRMMVKVLLYAYCRGVRSSRKIAQHLEEDVAFRVLAANNQPDFRTISDFRKIHLERLKGLFIYVLRLCQETRLVKLGYVALDGTKVKASASKHKAMSYAGMCEAEKELEEEVKKLLTEASGQMTKRTSCMVRTAVGMNCRSSAFWRNRRKAEASLAEARRQARKDKHQDGEKPDAAIVGNKPSEEQEAVPESRAQYNFTEPESRIMKNSDKAYVQAYGAFRRHGWRESDCCSM